MTKCQGETEFTKKSVCKEHPVGGKIEYRVSVTPTRCFSGKKEVILKMVALEEQVSNYLRLNPINRFNFE